VPNVQQRSFHPGMTYHRPNPPAEVTAVIEIPTNERNKYESTRARRLSPRPVLYSAVHYPGDYGFLPGPSATTVIHSTCWSS